MARKTISIEDCVEQSGIPENDFRLLLTESHPEDYHSLQSIPLPEFELILRTIEAKRNGLAIAPSAPEAIDSEILPVQQQERIILSVDNALTAFGECYALDTAVLANALAYVAAKRVTAGLKDTFENTLNQDLNSFFDGLNSSLLTQIHTVAAINNDSFLTQRGVIRQSPKSQKELVTEAMQVLANL